MTDPVIQNLIDRLENTYSFECVAGALSNCAEWKALKSAIQGIFDPENQPSPTPAEALTKVREALKNSAQHIGSHGKKYQPCQIIADCNSALFLLPIIESAVQQWKPITTSPEHCLVKMENGELFEGFRCEDGRWSANDPRGGGDYYLYGTPTQWMELPQSPIKKVES